MTCAAPGRLIVEALEHTPGFSLKSPRRACPPCPTLDLRALAPRPTPMYLAPPTLQGPSSLRGVAGATRTHQVVAGAPQGVVGSEGVEGCAGPWTPRIVVSPLHPAGKKDQPGGVIGRSLVGRTFSQVLGRTSRCTYPEELLELRAVVERGDVHGEAKQVLGPLSPLLNHRGFEPACGPRTRGRERSSDPQAPLVPRPLFLVLPGEDLSSPPPYSPSNLP